MGDGPPEEQRVKNQSTTRHGIFHTQIQINPDTVIVGDLNISQ